MSFTKPAHLETPMPTTRDPRKPTQGDPHPCLSYREISRLIERLKECRGERGFSYADTLALLDWANQARWEEKTLRQLLEGSIGVDVTDAGLLFIAPEEADARRQTPVAGEGGAPPPTGDRRLASGVWRAELARIRRTALVAKIRRLGEAVARKEIGHLFTPAEWAAMVEEARRS